MKTKTFISIFAGFVLATSAAFGNGWGRLANLSVRAETGPGAKIVTAGFVPPAHDRNIPLPVLIRAMGPSLTKFGVPGALQKPKLTLYQGQTKVLDNADWSATPDVQAIADKTGAFPFTIGLTDAAIARSFGNGTFTCQMTAADGIDGIGLLELYAVPDHAWDSLAYFMNGSIRATTGPGAKVLTMGFAVVGDSLQVLIRGIGPTLRQYGVDGAASGVQIVLHQNSSGTDQVAVPNGNGGWVWKVPQGLSTGVTNDGWSSTEANRQSVASVGDKVGAFPLPVGSADSAMVVLLQPGTYTLQVYSKNPAPNYSDVVLAEIYDVDPDRVPIPPPVINPAG